METRELTVVAGSFVGFQLLFSVASPRLSSAITPGYRRLPPNKLIEWNSRCVATNSCPPILPPNYSPSWNQSITLTISLNVSRRPFCHALTLNYVQIKHFICPHVNVLSQNGKQFFKRAKCFVCFIQFTKVKHSMIFLKGFFGYFEEVCGKL